MLAGHRLWYHIEERLILSVGSVIHLHLFCHICGLFVFAGGTALLLPELAILGFCCHELGGGQGAGWRNCGVLRLGSGASSLSGI